MGQNPWLSKDICNNPKLTIVPYGKELQRSQKLSNDTKKSLLASATPGMCKRLQIYATTF